MSGFSNDPVLIVAAFHPELAPLRASLGEKLEGRIGAAAVVAKAVGIGMVNAAVGTTSRLAGVRPRAVVLIGTCGVYAGAGEGLAIGDVVVARRVRLVEPTVVEGRGAIPEPVSLVAACDAGLANALVAAAPRARLADVATTVAVTTDDALAALLARSSACEAEHLEAFAVATACAAHGVPFAAALGVANVVGARARDEWRVHHRAASEAAAAAVVAFLERAT